MDLAHLGFDTFFSSSNSPTTAAAENVGEINKQKSIGFGFFKQERAVSEDDFREFKVSKRSSGGADGCQQMLSFSSPGASANYHHQQFARGAGYGCRGGGMSTMQQQQQQGLKGPFTPSQWMELEHQALIYKYITANVPIPSYLLNPITKAFESAGFPALRSTALGWGGFQLGFGNSDPEPGRCRRTDGKKWRCSRDAVPEQKYCERHINRGRHRSRKPVEPVPGPTPAPAPGAASGASSLRLHTPPVSGISSVNRTTADKDRRDGGAYDHAPLVSPKDIRPNSYQQEFGLVCSDSLLNPAASLLNAAKAQHQLRHFMDVDDGPKTHLSISIPPASELEMGLGLGPQTHPNWFPISMGGGGPLGEVVAGECNFASSSPTGVLQRVSLSNGSAASSPRAEAFLLNPSLPAL